VLKKTDIATYTAA